MSDQKKIDSENNIDFFKLWRVIVEGKWIIIGITGILTLVSVIYTQTVTPTYKTSTYILPPLEQSIDVLNQKDTGKKIYTSEVVFSRLLLNINSVKLKREFFNDKNLINFYKDDANGKSYDEVFENFFSNKLTTEKPSKIDPKPYQEISFELKNKDPKFNADILNEFIKNAEAKTKKELLEEVLFEIRHEIKIINEQIQSKKELAMQRRLDRIAQLEESLVQAKKLGIENAQITQSDNKLNMDYNRGWRALEVELNVLKMRQSDESFIEGIRSLQERISYLNNLKFDIDQLGIIRVDQPALVAYEPVKPKKKIIIGFAFFFGLVFSFLIVLIREAIKKSRIAS